MLNFLFVLLCKVGYHKWEYNIDHPRVRVCLHCGRTEIIEFYSNRTQEWIELKKWSKLDDET